MTTTDELVADLRRAVAYLGDVEAGRVPFDGRTERLIEVGEALAIAARQARTRRDVEGALQRLHVAVRTRMTGVIAHNPHGEAVDALDWVLQRIDEEMEASR